MIYKVGIWGASGKMGQEVAFLLSEGFSIGANQLELADAVTFSGKLRSLEGVQVRTPSQPARDPVHVWIDFSRPEGTLKLMEESQAPLLIGTTGFSEPQMNSIKEFAKKQAVCLAPNLSPGIAWMRRCLKLGTPKGFDVVLEETHHTKKVDSPSGTAKSLSAILNESTGAEPKTFSVRAGGVPGEHRVRFVGQDEEFQLTHRVWNRSVFARGALIAAMSLAARKDPGLIELDDLLIE